MTQVHPWEKASLEDWKLFDQQQNMFRVALILQWQSSEFWFFFLLPNRPRQHTRHLFGPHQAASHVPGKSFLQRYVYIKTRCCSALFSKSKYHNKAALKMSRRNNNWQFYKELILGDCHPESLQSRPRVPINVGAPPRPILPAWPLFAQHLVFMVCGHFVWELGNFVKHDFPQGNTFN